MDQLDDFRGLSTGGVEQQNFIGTIDRSPYLIWDQNEGQHTMSEYDTATRTIYSGVTVAYTTAKILFRKYRMN